MELAAGIDIGVLGDLRATDRGTEVRIGGAKRRALLALLAAHAGAPVSASVIVDSVWRHSDPVTALRTCQTYVSHLRRQLPGAIETTAQGYRLDPSHVTIDSQVFEQMLKSPPAESPAATANRLRSALDLWRGDAFSEFIGHEWVMASAAHLEELRRVAFDQWAEAELTCTRHDSLVAALELACTAEPFREARWALLMTALYRCGRQGDALRAFARLRSALRDELGLEPNARLVELEGAILRQDPELLGARSASTRNTGGIASRPSGTVTFLFTDLEGSSLSWDREPTSTAASLEIHDEIVRGTVAAHGGYVFSTAGDSFAVAFAVAGKAVQAALDIQLALRATTWPAGVSMAVRMGLHTGHSVEREGDYFGPVVNRAARLMAAGHGGQIVCSDVTAQLARPEVGHNVEFRSLGRFRLRDLLEPEDVVQVGTADLRSSFPPLRTLAGRHNLPVQRTRLIGRVDEVARVAELVRGHRLVTLTGIGGCGKSRLALAVAAELSGDFTDGAFLVELAPVGDPDRFVSVVAEVAGVRVNAHEGGASRRSAIAAFMARRDMLIVLDNCEHLLDAVGEFVDEVLATGSAARVLATSREALEVPGEHSHRVPSLALGDVEGSGPAIELFLERAAESSGGLIVGERDRAVIADICRHLDGVPLAIELAAAQSLMMSPSELLAQLDRRFELLVGGRARRRQRQQTLQAVMDWSWGLLARDEQALLAGLSVFSGGWTLDAAEAVCSDLVEGTVAPTQRSLLAKSLIEAIEVGSKTRYRLLETVRLYAQQRLLETGRSEALRTSHCRWFVDWVEAVPLDERVLSFQWLARMTTEFDNLAAAVDWAIDRDPDAAARLVASCTGLALAGVGTSETLRWVAALLEHQLDDAVRARLLTSGAFAAVSGGEHARIIPWAAEAADLARHGDQFVVALASIWQAAPRMVGQPDVAAAFMDDARAAAATTASRLCRGFVDCWSLSEAMCAGDVSSVDVSPVDAGRFGGRDTWGWSGAVQVGSIALAEQGRLADALALVAQFSPLEVADDAAGGYDMMVTAIAGAPEDARRLAAKFIEDVDRLGDVRWHTELVLALGLCHLREGAPGIAFAYFDTAKRAPMFQPFWYALTRRYASRARETLDDEAVADAKQHSRSLTVETILDHELRAIAHDRPLNPPTDPRATRIQQGIGPIPEDTRPH